MVECDRGSFSGVLGIQGRRRFGVYQTIDVANFHRLMAEWTLLFVGVFREWPICALPGGCGLSCGSIFAVGALNSESSATSAAQRQRFNPK